MRNFFIILFFFLMASTYGQTMTAYEKKGYSLTVQFLRKLGVDEVVLQKSSKMGDLEKLIVAGNFIEKLNTERGLMLMLEYEREMKEAEKLKTAVDFQRDKEKKAETERKKQIEIAKQKERQLQADLENQEKQKKESYNNSDYVHIKSSIKEDLNQWLQKGEFEKTDDYQNRISNNSSKTFDSICYKKLTYAFKTKSGFSSNLLKYNADTEKFGIEFTFNDVVFDDSINIPIKGASKFKNDVENFGIYVDDKDWGFIDNNLTPSKITYFNSDTKESFEFYFASKDLKRISFSSSELGLNSSINVNSKFNFDEFYYNRAIETKDGSAINTMGWDCLLNQNFPKALRILERGVPLINDNDEVYPYLLTNLAHAYLFDKQFDKAHKIYFENFSLKLNGKSWKYAILQDFAEFRKRGIYSADMEKIEKEFSFSGEIDEVKFEKNIQPENNYQNQEDDKVFTKVENEAEFPGGNSAWVRYVQKSLGSFNPADSGAAPGRYQVLVQFVVNKDGSISHVKTETSFGYGMEEKSIKLIQNGPKWNPALVNGRQVSAYRIQPITFIVEEKN